MSKIGDLNEWLSERMKEARTPERQNELIKTYKERRKSVLEQHGRRKAKDLSRYVNTYGYTMIKVNEKWVQEHRFIWEQANGPIPKGWITHHLNGKRDDNSLGNLAALSRNKHSTSCLMQLKTDRIRELEEQVRQLNTKIETTDTVD